jgi:hypothetical protein
MQRLLPRYIPSLCTGIQGRPLNRRHSRREVLTDMLGVFAEFETNLRRERQLEGIAKAKAAGVYKGRPASIDEARVRELKAQGIEAHGHRQGDGHRPHERLSGARRIRACTTTPLQLSVVRRFVPARWIVPPPLSQYGSIYFTYSIEGILMFTSLIFGLCALILDGLADDPIRGPAINYPAVGIGAVVGNRCRVELVLAANTVTPGEMEGDSRVAREPRDHLGMLVGGIVVEDDVDGLLRRNSFLNGVEEADELLVTMALHASADHLAFQHVEGGEHANQRLMDERGRRLLRSVD